MEEDGIPGLGTYSVPDWAAPPSGEATATPASYSQVPGTSGAPRETASATPGGVSSGNPAGGPQSPWGSLAGLMGLNAPQTMAGAMRPGQGMKIAQLGMRMLAPPASPLRMGAPAPTLSAAGQNPQMTQFQQMFGVDPATAQAMLAMLHPGATAMAPQQQAQNVYSGGAFMPPQMPMTPPSPLMPMSNLPTPQNPYGAPRMGMATPAALASNLPPLTGGAFPGTPPLAGLSSQMLTGMPQMAEGGRPDGPTIVGERGPEVFVPDMPGSIVPIPRHDTGFDNILRAMELGARIQRRRFGIPEEDFSR